MKINHTNPNLNLMNTLGVEQAARKAAQEKAAESAKARAAEEAQRLQQISETLKGKKPVGKIGPDSKGQQGRRNARYLPDGTVQPEGSDGPDDSSNPPPRGGIDIKA